MNGSIGPFQITIWTTHLKKGVSVSDTEIACNWILKKTYSTHWYFIGSYQGLLIAEIDSFQLEMWPRQEAAYCLFYESDES